MIAEYVIFKCRECGTVFIMPSEHVDLKKTYLTCPNHGEHMDIKVCGAYDDLNDCMHALPKCR